MKTLIKTNHQWRPFTYRTEVPAAVLERQFDYQDPEDVVDGFLCYRGTWYHLDQFMRTGDLSLLGYDGFHGDSFFSGVAIKLSSDGERYQVATVICVG